MNNRGVLAKEPNVVVLRVFATTPESAQKRAEAVVSTVETLLMLQVEGRYFFRDIDVVVWDDPRYVNPDGTYVSDCGATFSLLKTLLPKDKRVQLCQFSNGGLFVDLLNNAVARHRNAHWITFMSVEAVSYLTEDTAIKMLTAMCNPNVHVVGVTAVPELVDSVCKGRLINTLATWRVIPLIAVSGFDSRAENPWQVEMKTFVQSWTRENGIQYYPRAGVEEIYPLIQLVQKYNACLAPILVEQGTYVLPDPTNAELLARHLAKISTKFLRQLAHAMDLGVSLSFLKGGVLEEYRVAKYFNYPDPSA